jgi:F-type H+-transporting ATPase subunit b
MADILLLLVGAAEGEHSGPSALWLSDYQWVSVAMLILVAILIWKKVPSLITGGLDSKIQAIKDQLDEAKSLRAEAESLRDEYAARMADAEKHAEAMLENAQRDADSILEKAESDSKLMVERRKRMAEDKIAAAEREAVEEVKAVAVNAAAAAARTLIAKKHGADADKKLADEVIASI